MPNAEVTALAERVAAAPVRYSADRLAWRLGVTMNERMALRLTTIGAIDCNKAERLELRREKRRARDRARWAKQRSGKPRGRPKLNLRPAGITLVAGDFWPAFGIAFVARRAIWAARGYAASSAPASAHPMQMWIVSRGLLSGTQIGRRQSTQRPTYEPTSGLVSDTRGQASNSG